MFRGEIGYQFLLVCIKSPKRKQSFQSRQLAPYKSSLPSVVATFSRRYLTDYLDYRI